MQKVTILQNFATIGIPDFDEELGKNWSIAALASQLIDENRLKILHQLNTRRLDLVIHNGKKFALLNLQAFKIFDCPLATSTVQQCLAYHLSTDGQFLFGIQPSGDVIILTGGLQITKHIKKSTYIKPRSGGFRLYDWFPSRIWGYFTGTSRKSESKSNQVSPEPSHSQYPLPTSSSNWWPFQTSSQSQTTTQPPPPPSNHFPYITALPDGLGLLIVYSASSCYIFVSSYDTALRSRSIANFRGSHVPGRWHRIIMHKEFILEWLKDKNSVPWFEAKLCYCKSDEPGVKGNNLIGGAIVYAVEKEFGIEIVYGIIKRRREKFTLHWEKVEYQVDWAFTDGPLYNLGLGSRFVARLSSDCTKLAVVITTSLGTHTCIQELPVVSASPIIQLQRNVCALCNHSDYDGTHFYKKDCWISDVQWLVEDIYIAVMTLCGSLSIFYAKSGQPMFLKVRKPGAEADESKSTRFFFPVFHPHQIRSNSQDRVGTGAAAAPTGERFSPYPTMKWIDSEKVLTCSSGMKIELFSIQQVINLPKTEQVNPTPEKVKEEFKSTTAIPNRINPSSTHLFHQLIQAKKNLASQVGEDDRLPRKEPEPLQVDYNPPRFPRNSEVERVRSRVKTIASQLIIPIETTSDPSLPAPPAVDEDENDIEDRPLTRAGASRHSLKFSPSQILPRPSPSADNDDDNENDEDLTPVLLIGTGVSRQSLMHPIQITPDESDDDSSSKNNNDNNFN